jgi:hypothetical protein
MMVLQIGMDLRCGREFQAWNPQIALEPHLVLVHRGDDTEKCIGDTPGGASELNEWLRNPVCRGVLVLRGTAFAGIGRERALDLERRTAGRVHVLSYAVDPADEDVEISPLFKSRIDRLITRFEQDGNVYWDLVDPQLSEAVIGTYAVLAAILLMEARDEPVEGLMTDRGLRRMLELAYEELSLMTGVARTAPDRITIHSVRQSMEELGPHVMEQLYL